MILKAHQELRCFKSLLFFILLIHYVGDAKNIEVLNKDTKKVLVSIENVPLEQYFSEGSVLMDKKASPQVVLISGDTVFKASGPATKDFIVQFQNDRFTPQAPQSSAVNRTISGLSLDNNVLRNEIVLEKIPLADYKATTSAQLTPPVSQKCPECSSCPTVDDVKAAKFLSKLGAADFKEAKNMLKEMTRSISSLITEIYGSFQEAANSKIFGTLFTKLAQDSDPDPTAALDSKRIKNLNDSMVNVVHQLKAHYLDYQSYLFQTGPIIKAYETFIEKRKTIEEEMKKTSTHEQQVELLWKLVNSLPAYPAVKVPDVTDKQIKELKLK